MLSTNDRVEHVDGDLGTIRYIGPVCTSKDPSAEWYGIAWDPNAAGESRGKHNGSVHDPISNTLVTYFLCSATGGSFVKVDKLKPFKTVVQALTDRYGKMEESNYHQAGSVGTAQGKEKPIEFIGAKKISLKQKLICLEKVDLSQSSINVVGDDLQSAAPGIQQLVLSLNCFSKWSEVFELQHQLVHLTELVLSGNRLQYDLTAPADCLPNVTILVLNQTNSSWTDIQQLMQHFPAIEELHLVGNHMPRQTSTTTLQLPTLTTLDISNNGFDWDGLVALFGHFPLKQLTAENNAIDKIGLPAASPAFAQLESLSLSGNNLSQWTSIDALNQFPALKVLRLQQVPLTSALSSGEVRQLVIARVKSLEVFNNSSIRPREREDAEKLYYRRIVHELAAAAAGSEEDVLRAHPRYQELNTKFRNDVVVSSAAGDSSASSTLAQSMVSVQLVSLAMESMTFEPIKKKLPLRMTVAQLKLMLEKRFKEKVDTQILSFAASKKSMPTPLDDDSCELGYYGVQDNSTIYLNTL